jgi:hypothetical protein
MVARERRRRARRHVSLPPASVQAIGEGRANGGAGALERGQPGAVGGAEGERLLPIETHCMVTWSRGETEWLSSDSSSVTLMPVTRPR